MKFFIFIFATFIAPLTLQAHGGGSVISGGGNGVMIGKRVYLLDLYEHGNYLHPVVIAPPSYAVTGDLLEVAGLSLSIKEQNLLRDKISDISLLDPILAMAVQQTISGVLWSFEEAPLKPIDPDTQILAHCVQLATRTGNQVLVHRPYWRAMDTANRVALIIHEAIAALADKTLTVAQPIRSLTARIFDNAAYPLGLDVRYDLVHFPSIEAFKKQLSITTLLRVNNREIGDLRFVDGPWADAPGLNPVSELQFQPFLRLAWSDGVSELAMSLPPQVCGTLSTGRHLTRVDAGFYSIEAHVDPELDEGAPLPHYVWKAVARNRARIDFNGDAAKATVAACSTDNAQQLEFLNQWLAQFSSQAEIRP